MDVVVGHKMKEMAYQELLVAQQARVLDFWGLVVH